MVAVVTTAAMLVIGVGAWFFAQHRPANSSTPAIQVRWTPLFIGGLIVAVFLAILVVGFIYEWKKGALEWD